MVCTVAKKIFDLLQYLLLSQQQFKIEYTLIGVRTVRHSSLIGISYPERENILIELTLISVCAKIYIDIDHYLDQVIGQSAYLSYPDRKHSRTECTAYQCAFLFIFLLKICWSHVLNYLLQLNLD